MVIDLNRILWLTGSSENFGFNQVINEKCREGNSHILHGYLKISLKGSYFCLDASFIQHGFEKSTSCATFLICIICCPSRTEIP